MKKAFHLIFIFSFFFAVSTVAANTKSVNLSSTGTNPCSVTINQDLSFTIPNAIYDGGPLVGQMELTMNFKFFGEQNGQLLWQLGSVGTSTSSASCSISIAPDLSFTLANAVYDAGPLLGQMTLQADLQYSGEQNGAFLWYLAGIKTINDLPVDLQLDKPQLTIEAGKTETVTISGGTGTYQPAVSSNASVVDATMQSSDKITILGVSSGTATVTVEDSSGSTVNLTVTVTSAATSIYCGAYVAPGVWKEFDCYNLAAIGKTTNDDPFTPSWRLIGGYWQWGRKGPDPSQWYDTNTLNFAHGPTGPGSSEANDGAISSWDSDYAPDGAWSDASKTTNDPCPDGFRVPTQSHWQGVIDNNSQSTVGTWTSGSATFYGGGKTNYNAALLFGCNLMLPAAGRRIESDGAVFGSGYSGAVYNRGYLGQYWSSSEYDSNNSWSLRIINESPLYDTSNFSRRNGYSVRCVEEGSTSQPPVLTVQKTSVNLKSAKEKVSISGGTGYYTAISSDTQVAVVNLNGSSLEITGLSAGAATITVEDSGGATATISVTVTSTATLSCGAYVAPGVWKEFDCYNLAAIGKTTGDDPFTPSWRLIGGYWQWGRKGPDSSQWYDTNTEHFAHGPTGPDSWDANSGTISGWDSSYAPNGAWSATKTVNDPCPAGYKVPTNSEWEGVLDNNTQSIVGTWDSEDNNYSAARFFGSDLMLPAAGYRSDGSGGFYDRGYDGRYWSSSEYSGLNAWHLYFFSGDANTYFYYYRRYGFSVRCVAE